ncbi:hypothetical protein OXX80_004512 [Metschnikowia pulcherrima]
MFRPTPFALFASVLASQWDTYPSVAKTASINGFADPIMSNLPTCAQDCVSFSVSNTPCPYWDTGCLCVMPQWSGEVAECIISKCSEASDVASATSAAYSLCSSVGANVWMMPASLSTELEKAASVTGNTVSTTEASDSASVTGSQSATTTTSGNSTVSATSSQDSLSSTSSSASSSQSSTANNGITLHQTGFLTFFSVILVSLLA